MYFIVLFASYNQTQTVRKSNALYYGILIQTLGKLMKYGRWEIGQFGGAIILLCGFISKIFGASVSSAVGMGAILGFIIISSCLVLEIFKGLKTGKIETFVAPETRHFLISEFIVLERSSSPFNFYLHIIAYVSLATYCSYYGFYYAFLLTKEAFA